MFINTLKIILHWALFQARDYNVRFKNIFVFIRYNVALDHCRIEEQGKVGTRSNYRQTAIEFISIVARTQTNIYYSLSYPQRIILQVRIMFSICVGIKVSLTTGTVA